MLKLTGNVSQRAAPVFGVLNDHNFQSAVYDVRWPLYLKSLESIFILT